MTSTSGARTYPVYVQATSSFARPQQILRNSRFVIQAGNGPNKVSDATFEKRGASSRKCRYWLILVDWCGPCKAASSIVEKLAADYEGRLKVLQIDVDQNGRTLALYGIRGIPALLIFNNSKPKIRRTRPTVESLTLSTL